MPTLVQPTASAAVVTPTLTPEPLAALVNGEGILLVDFEAERARVVAAAQATGTALEDSRITELAINELVDQLLLAQAARKNGFQLSEEELAARISDLTGKVGGVEAMKSWMNQNGFTEESFKRWMRIGIEAAWQQDRWLAEVPAFAEQIHVRQIFTKDQGKATSAFQQLQAGADFLELAAEFDPLTGGDLGWLIPGFVLYPNLDEAIFSLQVGQYSNIVQTEIGYHIVYIEAREADRELTPEMQDQVRNEKFTEWIAVLRAESNIEILIDS